MIPDWVKMLKPNGFWEWVLVLLVLGTALLFTVPPLTMMVLIAIHGIEL